MKALIVVVVVAAAACLLIVFWPRSVQASTRPLEMKPEPIPPPEPLFKPLPPGQEKTATVQTSQGPITLVQKFDTSGFNEITKPTATLPPGVTAVPLKPEFRNAFARKL